MTYDGSATGANPEAPQIWKLGPEPVDRPGDQPLDRLEAIRARYFAYHYSEPLLKAGPAGDADVGWLIDEVDRARSALEEARAEAEGWADAYELKVQDFARETARVSRALAACDRSINSAAYKASPVGEAGLGWLAAQEYIEKAIRADEEPGRPAAQEAPDPAEPSPAWLFGWESALAEVQDWAQLQAERAEKEGDKPGQDAYWWCSTFAAVAYKDPTAPGRLADRADLRAAVQEATPGHIPDWHAESDCPRESLGWCDIHGAAQEAEEPLDSQVRRLADFIVEHIPGEPSQSQGAIDTAIRILAKHYGIRPTGEPPAPRVWRDPLGEEWIERPDGFLEHGNTVSARTKVEQLFGPLTEVLPEPWPGSAETAMKPIEAPGGGPDA